MKRLLISNLWIFHRDESRIWNNNFNEIFLSPSYNLISRLGNHFLSRILETFPPGRSKRSFQILMEGQPLDYFRFPYAVVWSSMIEHRNKRNIRTPLDENSFTSIPRINISSPYLWKTCEITFVFLSIFFYRYSCYLNEKYVHAINIHFSRCDKKI